jgi:hypothetical protein
VLAASHTLTCNALDELLDRISVKSRVCSKRHARSMHHAFKVARLQTTHTLGLRVARALDPDLRVDTLGQIGDVDITV